VLEVLRELGAELIPFSPLADKKLPDARLLWLGGGYPELFARELFENRAMIEAVRRFSGTLYAECGGYIYLAQGVYFEGLCHPLAGLVPEAAQVRERPTLGYREVTPAGESGLFPKGAWIRGHEFHYAEIEEKGPYFWKERSGSMLGYQKGRVHASFVHLYLLSNRRALEGFLSAASRLS